MYILEEQRLKEEIRSRKAKRVLLQFPDGLKPLSTEVVRRLGELLPEVEFLTSGEPSFGSCDIAEDEARLLNVDLIVHFGHTPYTWYYPKFPTLFVDAKSTLTVTPEELNELRTAIRRREARTISLTSTVQHSDVLKEVANYLRSEYEVKIGKPSNPFMYDGQVWGCDYKAATTVNADVYINVSGGEFHSLGLGLATGKPTLNLDPYTGTVKDVTEEVWKVLKVRYSKMYKAMEGTTWVVIQGLKVGQNRPLMVKYLVSSLEKRGMRTFTFTSKYLTKESIRNFDRSYIDAYVVTSCPRLPTDDFYDFEKPVLTPGEAKMIITGKMEPYIFPW
ncbi:diphthamide biosynthesis enzyme Dph2 [Sulfodiicoccus acidiphilus]|uniref:2-(3-amino-3-carboxypropyl)histidine synthase n=1 Tax=Sulfodiicoccus acidiphilus TaxID=1670455 RepID=A0A348B6Z9_9CREN|nr:diphthamide biosynthesis enzyme Dph2 [Sulfodiicoccus acidiphilus]BBD73951.1 diphthamide biosynthesis enzyme Dph2 [Sulfodiicoccus acidiphilus]GGU03227.1 diphthamide biosynthesis enzyme Dph2 [Sulfodiicoccus acidiphilus]